MSDGSLRYCILASKTSVNFYSFSWWSLESRVIWSLIHMLDLDRPLGHISLCSGDEEINPQTERHCRVGRHPGGGEGIRGTRKWGIHGGKNPQGDEGN